MLRLFRNKRFLLILTTLVLLIVIAVASRPGGRLGYVGDVLNVPLSPVQKFFSLIGQKVEGVYEYFTEMGTLKKENDELKAEIDSLESDKRELLRYKEENNNLRDMLDLKEQMKDYQTIGGNIIAKDMGNWFNTFTIDRGSSDGLKIDSPVITSKGLVGSVIETMPFSAKVLSIIDPDSTVSAVVTKSMDLVRIRGDMLLMDQGLCRMDYIDMDVDIAVGDTIETSGLGGIYPRGILIGKVKSINKDADGLNRYAVIEPAVDFKRLQVVFAMKNISKQTETGNGQ